ncbi:hypothetical protein AKJ09_05629 [Labilithrix luteola]|uniref:Uncharacterized protein n=1 Tax=Labilithrix luteola TaxID=1391654 RepID=A0A0K1PZK3_9BACT|nr:hypothetical protein [Labilithrix luteola]AKU98965.1 hypothetical protein AKJ09_05629 [Labilithrix luteola]
MKVALSSFVALALGLFVAPAFADGSSSTCFPACRSGFVCTPDGRCVSECNPPCADGEICEAHECRARNRSSSRSGAAPTEIRSSSRSALSTGQDAATDADDGSEPAKAVDGAFGMHTGPVVFIANASTPGLAFDFRYKTRGDHAFVAGARAAVGFADGPDFFAIGPDLGYRGNFAHGNDLQAGLLVLAQPQIWAGGSAAMLYMGAAVGGFVQYGHFEIQLPIGLGFGTLLKEPFKGASRDLGAVATIGLLGGVVF